MKRVLPVLFVVLLVAAAAPAAAQKKVLRIHTAGPNDIGVDNTMLARDVRELRQRQLATRSRSRCSRTASSARRAR